ncbi:hypothetical protein [Actinoallomurus sp. CA-150999]|uniref:hypothetical protein n=1 Tax=Actinoallomurus sp. CA-150999 TaxID=3239887 RepID=UPI003D919CBB
MGLDALGVRGVVVVGLVSVQGKEGSGVSAGFGAAAVRFLALAAGAVGATQTSSTPIIEADATVWDPPLPH